MLILQQPSCAQQLMLTQPYSVYINTIDQYALACRSLAESVGRPDWRDLLTGKGSKDKRSGLGIYGTTKMFNIMLAREYSRRLQACPQHTAPASFCAPAFN